MSKDKIEVSMNVYDIPIVIEELEKAEKEIKQLQQENQQLKKSIKLFTDDLANMTNRALQLEKQKEELKDILKIKLARYRNEEDYYLTIEDFEDLLRMLGETDE